MEIKNLKLEDGNLTLELSSNDYVKIYVDSLNNYANIYSDKDEDHTLVIENSSLDDSPEELPDVPEPDEPVIPEEPEPEPEPENPNVEQVFIGTSANDKSMGSVTGMGTYNKGTTVILTAVANDGYRFVSWGDGNTDNPRTVIANDNGVVYSAIFEPVSKTMSLYENRQLSDETATVIELHDLKDSSYIITVVGDENITNHVIDKKAFYIASIQLLKTFCNTCLDKAQKEKITICDFKMNLLDYALENNILDDSVQLCKELSRLLNLNTDNTLNNCTVCKNGYCQIC